MKRLRLLLLGLALLLSFAMFSRSVKRGGMKDVDFTVTVKVQDRMRLTGEIMEGATFLANPLISIIAVTVITIITLVKRKKWRMAALVIPIAFGLMTVAEIYGKSVVHHPAPPFFLLKNPMTIFPKYYVWEDYSYPSGHMARATFLVVLLFLTMKKRLWVVSGLTVYIILIGISRIYLGHHWLSDVMGGLALGSGSGLLTSALLLSYNRGSHERVA